MNWAMIQNNLGNAYADRIAGEKPGNLEEAEQAIGCYGRALEVRTREAFPSEHALVTRNLESALVALEDLTSGESA